MATLRGCCEPDADIASVVMGGYVPSQTIHNGTLAMIVAELKSIDWIDEIPRESAEAAMIAMTATIGRRGEEGGDLFQIVVCNPAWIASELMCKTELWPRGFLIVHEINPGQVESSVQSLVRRFSPANDWEEFADKMDRYLQWEFEDYEDR